MFMDEGWGDGGIRRKKGEGGPNPSTHFFISTIFQLIPWTSESMFSMVRPVSYQFLVRVGRSELFEIFFRKSNAL